MDTKKISLVIIFAAISMVLNSRFPGLVIPSFIPGFWFYFWEIPIIVALLLLGLKPAVFISLLNGIILFVAYTGPGYQNPLANLIASLTTLLGVYLAKKLVIDRYFQKQKTSKFKETIISTSFAILIRVLIMIPFVYVTLRLLTTVPEETLVAFLPILTIFDVIVPGYSVPVAYFVETKIRNKLLLNHETDIIHD